jgi:hypothetical protein
MEFLRRQESGSTEDYGTTGRQDQPSGVATPPRANKLRYEIEKAETLHRKSTNLESGELKSDNRIQESEA